MGDETELPPTVANIGTNMLDVHQYGYALPFEIVSILLLAALIGCIVIAASHSKSSQGAKDTPDGNTNIVKKSK